MFIIANLPLGILSALLRALKGALINFWLLPRMDISAMGRVFERCDNGYYSYMCMLTVENAHSNPCLLMFVHILQKLVCFLCPSAFIKRNLQAEKHSCTLNDLVLTPVKSTGKRPITGLSLRQSRRARQRWFLAITLARNPVLLQVVFFLFFKEQLF